MGRSVVIAGGGTGGHVYPGLALGAELLRRHPEWAVSWIGARGGLEASLVPRAGLPLRLLPMGGVLGRGALRLDHDAECRCPAGLRLGNQCLQNLQ